MIIRVTLAVGKMLWGIRQKEVQDFRRSRTWQSHRAESSGIASHWPCPLWVWTTCPLSRWWTLCGVRTRQWLDWRSQIHNLSYRSSAANSTHPASLSSCSCSVMKHSSHTDRYSMAILASFLYAFPMAPLLASNWTTFTTLCGGVKENNWGTTRHLGAYTVFCCLKELRLSLAASVKGYGFFKRLFSDQRDLRSPCVAFQIVARPVGTPHDLDPALQQGINIYFEQNFRMWISLISFEDKLEENIRRRFWFQRPSSRRRSEPSHCPCAVGNAACLWRHQL